MSEKPGTGIQMSQIPRNRRWLKHRVNLISWKHLSAKSSVFILLFGRLIVRSNMVPQFNDVGKLPFVCSVAEISVEDGLKNNCRNKARVVGQK